MYAFLNQSVCKVFDIAFVKVNIYHAQRKRSRFAASSSELKIKKQNT